MLTAEQSAQNSRPQRRQWWRRLSNVNGVEQPQHMLLSASSIHLPRPGTAPGIAILVHCRESGVQQYVARANGAGLARRDDLRRGRGRPPACVLCGHEVDLLI